MATEQLVLPVFYNPGLVLLSVLISILGAYAAFDLIERLRDARGRARLAWLAGGATADAIGIWSMHYTGMMGFVLSAAAIPPRPIIIDTSVHNSDWRRAISYLESRREVDSKRIGLLRTATPNGRLSSSVWKKRLWVSRSAIVLIGLALAGVASRDALYDFGSSTPGSAAGPTASLSDVDLFIGLLGDGFR